MTSLAIHGGTPVRTKPFPQYVTLGPEEKRAVMEVMDDGVLSKFLGTWSPDFFGGPRVQKLEREWESYFRVAHAVSMNSATSGLYAAVGAAGVGPGDEVIVSPYTMIASATAAIAFGAIPVFADIDPDIFCITAETIRRCITPQTKAIIVVHIFGHPADMDAIMALAEEHNLIVIEDNAQGPASLYRGRYAGTIGHMGVFSLNYHKTIHSGEGGVVVTGDPELAERLQLIRNHAEVVVAKKGVENIVNMVGQNYRMTEIEAAIASEQLKKLKGLLTKRVGCAEYLDKNLAGLPGLKTPVVRADVLHGYYLYSMRYDARATGVSRERLGEALRAEGIPLALGYVRPIYLEPMYQRRIAFGKDGFPFTYSGYRGQVSYERGICPVVEQMHFEELMYHAFCHASMTEADLADIVRAFHKVFENLASLR